MKQRAQVKIPESVREQIVSTICDICGDKAPKTGEYGYPWNDNGYSANEVTIEYKTGDRYPDGGFGTTIAPDICPTCMETKVLPALKALGCRIEEEDWDY